MYLITHTLQGKNNILYNTLYENLEMCTFTQMCLCPNHYRGHTITTLMLSLWYNSLFSANIFTGQLILDFSQVFTEAEIEWKEHKR